MNVNMNLVWSGSGDISRIKIISIWKNLRKPRCISLIKAGYEFCVVISEDTRGISANQGPALPGPANQRPVWGDTSDQCSRQISPAPAVPRLQPLLLQLTHFLSSFNLGPSYKWWNITHHNPQCCSQWLDLPSLETYNFPCLWFIAASPCDGKKKLSSWQQGEQWAALGNLVINKDGCIIWSLKIHLSHISHYEVKTPTDRVAHVFRATSSLLFVLFW